MEKMNSIHEKILREAELSVQRKIEQEKELVKRKALADQKAVEYEGYLGKVKRTSDILPNGWKDSMMRTFLGREI